MMDWIMGRRKAPEQPLPREQGPLKVAIGGALEIDTLSLQASFIGQQTSLPLPNLSPFIVAGIGQAMLEADMQLTRYYDDEDRMIQVMGAPGCGPEDIEDATIFIPWDSVCPANASEWAAWTGPSGLLGMPTYDADGTLFQRFWGDGDGRMDLVEFTETVEADATRREIRQKCMLYARDLGPMREMLLILTQRDLGGHAAHNGTSIEFMIGYGLNTADLARV